ncbi:hypothetical protein Pgy4_39910, partial [Pseudomonas savastanoi pv. glycinea str. race 4]
RNFPLLSWLHSNPFDLPQFQSELISFIQKANPKTIVVLQ